MSWTGWVWRVRDGIGTARNGRAGRARLVPVRTRVLRRGCGMAGRAVYVMSRYGAFRRGRHGGDGYGTVR